MPNQPNVGYWFDHTAVWIIDHPEYPWVRERDALICLTQMDTRAFASDGRPLGVRLPVSTDDMVARLRHLRIDAAVEVCPQAQFAYMLFQRGTVAPHLQGACGNCHDCGDLTEAWFVSCVESGKDCEHGCTGRELIREIVAAYQHEVRAETGFDHHGEPTPLTPGALVPLCHGEHIEFNTFDGQGGYGAKVDDLYAELDRTLRQLFFRQFGRSYGAQDITARISRYTTALWDDLQAHAVAPQATQEIDDTEHRAHAGAQHGHAIQPCWHPETPCTGCHDTSGSADTANTKEVTHA